jgi:hypothetical protein
MSQPDQVEEATIDKNFIDAYPQGMRIVLNASTGEHSPQTIADALQDVVDRVCTERCLALQPLRLILVTANLSEAANFWNRELGLPEAGVSGGAVGKHFSWGVDLASARSIVLLHVGIAIGLVSGSSVARATVVHEFGHVHDDLARGLQIGFPQPGLSHNLNDWPRICAHLAEIIWSEFAAEYVAASYITADELQEFVTTDPGHLSGLHGELRQLVQSWKVGQLDFPSLWSRSVTNLSDLFANLGRAAARFDFATNGAQARLDFVDGVGAAAPWKPIVERIFLEIDALADTAYSLWAAEPFRGLEQLMEAGFNAAGFFPIPCGQDLRVKVQ